MNNQLDSAVLVAALFAAGFYLCMSRRLLRVMFGFFLLSNGVNLVLLGSSGDPTGKRAPVIGDGVGGVSADPVPQALILTAIVIGFAVAAYVAVLVYRIYADHGVATVTSLFDGQPAAGTPAALERADEAERRRVEHAHGHDEHHRAGGHHG
jgi:multicomponent Na+:H+ antiporter subunit C